MFYQLLLINFFSQRDTVYSNLHREFSFFSLYNNSNFSKLITFIEFISNYNITNKIMDSLTSLKENFNIQLNYPELALNLIIAALLAWLLEFIFINYSNSINNKKVFSKNFVIIATTTAFIISIVKSSLALSLGLVGALSIIRFRTAIKEPEEISYLFICIGIGLGLGANYKLITIMAILLIIILIIIKEKFLGIKKFQVRLYIFH